MKKKIILLAVCAVLLLFFASSSYGEVDPKYIRLMEHPWEHMLSPKIDNDQGYNLVVFVIYSRFYLVFKSQHNFENSIHFDKRTDQKLSTSLKQSSFNTRNETEPEK